MLITRLSLILFAIMPFVVPLEAGITDLFSKPANANAKPPAIKVLIVQSKPGVILEVKGKYHLYDPHKKEYLGLRYLGKRKFIQALRDGLQWEEEFPGVHQLHIVPDHPTTTTIVDGIEYRGSIYVYDVEGAICVVNEVDIEDFIQSMLAPQARETHPQEAWAAIAIAARTLAYYQMQHPWSPFWAVNGSQLGYQGYAVTYCNHELNAAVDATRYLIMSKGFTKEGYVVPFSALWQEQNASAVGNSGGSQISLREGDELAKKGEHAAQILAKAYPGTNIVLMHQTPIERHLTAR